jgi:VWFA-related protein
MFRARALACVLFSIVVGAYGQAPAPPIVPVSPNVYRSDAKIRVDSDLVLIPVTVTDHSGKVIQGLEKEHFTVFEDGTQQEITHFAAEDAPASIGIVFDASDSMGPKMRKAREAVYTLLANANPDDEFFLVRFSTEAGIAVPMTKNPEEIRTGVDMIQVHGTTALLDGVRLAMNEMKERARYTRKAIIIISDGEDNASRWTVSELKSAVREQDIVIYAIGIIETPVFYYTSAPPDRRGAALLHEIASQTGGRLFEVSHLKQLPGIAAKIGGWLRSQYVLGYVPNRSEKDGAYRKVDLTIARPKGYPRLRAVWRQGYYALKE